MHQQNTFSDIESALSFTYSPQPVQKSINRDENTSCEEQHGSNIFDGGCVGKTPTSSLPMEENHARGHEGHLKQQLGSSVELKMSRSWSEEEEHVRWGCSNQVLTL